MIKANAEGAIVVEVNGQVYDLSKTEQYAEFLIWLTEPDKTTVVPSDAFDVSQDVPEDYVAKAERYSGFLKDFAERRTTKLAELDESLTFEERKAAINRFISKLKCPNR